MNSWPSNNRRVAVIGLGKIGLPLVVQFANSGWKVFGADKDQGLVGALNRGVNHLPNEPGIDEGLKRAISGGNFKAYLSISDAVSEVEVVIVVVPLVVRDDGTPEFDALDDVTAQIAASLRKGALVLYETTLPVGTTRGRFAPVLTSGDRLLGSDVFIAFSPERVFSGRILEDLRTYPKIVGGVDKLSGLKARDFYRSVLNFDHRDDLHRDNDVWLMANSEAAEFAKLAETTYRDTNIALANEFALHARDLGLSFAEIREACNSQPHSHLHKPGIAVGGHCIPVYPQLYLLSDPSAELVRTARRVNDSMPIKAVDLLEGKHGQLAGVRVLIMGLAYRGGVKEHAFSGAWTLYDELEKRGANPYVSDPLYSVSEIENLGLSPHRGERVEAVMIQTDHDEYTSTKLGDLAGAKTVIDGRGVLSPSDFPGVFVISLVCPDSVDSIGTSK